MAEALAQIELDDSDDALMARVAARDAVAFRTIVERHLTSVHRVAYRMLGDAAGAEDVAQEALLRLWDHAGRWQSGGTGVGVLQAAADEGILSIGVDSNQNYLHPGKVLTSMMKRVDNAVYDAFTAGADLETGFNVMGLANGGVGYAMDDNNAALFTPEMTAAIEAAQASIIDGSIEVHKYNSDETCPALDF